MNEECNHYWEPSNVDSTGSAEFRMFMGKPATHATCKVCNTRTWFTKEQWAEIPATSDPTISES